MPSVGLYIGGGGATGGAGGIGGSGTAGTLPKFSAATTLADSIVTDDGAGTVQVYDPTAVTGLTDFVIRAGASQSASGSVFDILQSNGDSSLTYNVLGKLTISNIPNTGSFSLKVNPAGTGNPEFQMPDDDGAPGEFLQTDGSGVLSWAAASGLSGLTAGQIPIADSPSSIIDSNLSYSSGVLSLLNSTNAQRFDLYNTFTSSTNNEGLKLAWDTNVAQVGTFKGSGGGTARALDLQTDATTRVRVGASGGVDFGAGTLSFGSAIGTSDVTFQRTGAATGTLTGDLVVSADWDTDFAHAATLTIQGSSAYGAMRLKAGDGSGKQLFWSSGASGVEPGLFAMSTLRFFTNGNSSYALQIDSTGMSDFGPNQVAFGSAIASADVGLKRSAAGLLKVTNASTGDGSLSVPISLQGTSTKTLTDNTIATFATVSCATSDSVVAGKVEFTIEAVDATNHKLQSITGIAPFWCSNRNGTVTAGFGTVTTTASDTADSATYTNTFAASVSGTDVNLRITSDYDQAVLTGTVTSRIRYRVSIDAGTATVTPA